MNGQETVKDCPRESTLLERASENAMMLVEVNAKLNSVVTLLANKLGIYARERLTGVGGDLQEKPPQVEESVDSTQYKISHNLRKYVDIVEDLSSIVDKI